MKKLWLFTVFILAFSFLQIFGMPISEADVPSFISGINILSPSNTTYPSRFLILNVTVSVFAGRNIHYSMSYSIDGQKRYVLSIENKPDPTEPWNRWTGGLYGATILPELTEGSHNITVYAESKIDPPGTGDTYIQKTVYFTVADTIPPIISNLSVENKTYSQLYLQLYFSVSEPTSWIGYSLDDEANRTTTGNTTLTAQAGPHTLILYANDTNGNMQKSDVILFTLNSPSPSPSPSTQPTVTPFSSPIQQPTLKPIQAASPIADGFQTANLAPMIILFAIVTIAIVACLLAYLTKH